MNGIGPEDALKCQAIHRLSSAIDIRVGVGFHFGDSAFMVLEGARFGELFLRLSDPTRVTLRPLKIGSRSDRSWPVATEARVPGPLVYVKLRYGGNALCGGLQLRDGIKCYPQLKHAQIRVLRWSSSLR